MGKFNICIVSNPWFSLGIHIDHTPPLYMALHLPGLLIAIGWIDILGATAEELIWTLRPVLLVELCED